MGNKKNMKNLNIVFLLFALLSNCSIALRQEKNSVYEIATLTTKSYEEKETPLYDSESFFKGDWYLLHDFCNDRNIIKVNVEIVANIITGSTLENKKTSCIKYEEDQIVFDGEVPVQLNEDEKIQVKSFEGKDKVKMENFWKLTKADLTITSKGTFKVGEFTFLRASEILKDKYFEGEWLLEGKTCEEGDIIVDIKKDKDALHMFTGTAVDNSPCGYSGMPLLIMNNKNEINFKNMVVEKTVYNDFDAEKIVGGNKKVGDLVVIDNNKFKIGKFTYKRIEELLDDDYFEGEWDAENFYKCPKFRIQFKKTEDGNYIGTAEENVACGLKGREIVILPVLDMIKDKMKFDVEYESIQTTNKNMRKSKDNNKEEVVQQSGTLELIDENSFKLGDMKFYYIDPNPNPAEYCADPNKFLKNKQYQN